MHPPVMTVAPLWAAAAATMQRSVVAWIAVAAAAPRRATLRLIDAPVLVVVPGSMIWIPY